MSYNTEALNLFAAGMADIQMDRNPLAQEVILVFNEVSRDQYQDSIVIEECRVKKQAMVKKNVDMEYVQQEGVVLLEEYDSLPWVVSLTITGLPRNPRLDDSILIGGILYTVSSVKPSNRSVDSILLISIYPDRSNIEQLQLFSIGDCGDGYMDVLYGGYPKEYAFTSEAINNRSLRFPFTSRPRIPSLEGELFLFSDDTYVSKKFKFDV